MNYTIDKFGTKIAIPGTTDDKISSLPDADTSKQLERIADILSELENLRRVATAAEEQAKDAKKRTELAEQKAKSAKKDATFSRIISILALLISAGSLAVAIISLVIR